MTLLTLTMVPSMPCFIEHWLRSPIDRAMMEPGILDGDPLGLESADVPPLDTPPPWDQPEQRRPPLDTPPPWDQPELRSPPLDTPPPWDHPEQRSPPLDTPPPWDQPEQRSPPLDTPPPWDQPEQRSPPLDTPPPWDQPEQRSPPLDTPPPWDQPELRSPPLDTPPPWDQPEWRSPSPPPANQPPLLTADAPDRASTRGKAAPDSTPADPDPSTSQVSAADTAVNPAGNTAEQNRDILMERQSISTEGNSSFMH